MESGADTGARADGESDGARPGRWRTGEESRRRILAAARSCFGERGYDRATIRAIAAKAEVDPAMVHYFFETKAQLFSLAMQFPVDVPRRMDAVIAEGVDGLGERLVRHFLSVWDEHGRFEPLLGLMRSAPTNPDSAQMFKQFVERELITRLRGAIEAEDADLRAELIGSHLIGMAVARYVVRLEPLASASPDAIVAKMGPALQHYVSGAL